jgi:CRISPR/Cas system-associated endonuclease Cas1
LVYSIESDNLSHVRKKLLAIEGHESNRYFKQVFLMFPKEVRVENRQSFKAYDGLNNTFNLAYSVLKWKVHRAILKAKLEPILASCIPNSLVSLP